MSNWPEEYKSASFSDLVNPIVDAIRFAYQVKRKNSDQDVPWNGPVLTTNRVAPITERLKAESLKYDNDEQGRDALEVLIGCAINLGIEQGMRMAHEELEPARLIAKFLQDALNKDSR